MGSSGGFLVVFFFVFLLGGKGDGWGGMGGMDQGGVGRWVGGTLGIFFFLSVFFLFKKKTIFYLFYFFYTIFLLFFFIFFFIAGDDGGRLWIFLFSLFSFLLFQSIIYIFLYRARWTSACFFFFYISFVFVVRVYGCMWAKLQSVGRV